MTAAAPNRTKVHGQRRIRQATGALVGAGLVLTGGVAVLINAGLGETASASSSNSSTVQNSTTTSTDLQVGPGSGDVQADSNGS